MTEIPNLNSKLDKVLSRLEYIDTHTEQTVIDIRGQTLETVQAIDTMTNEITSRLDTIIELLSK